MCCCLFVLRSFTYFTSKCNTETSLTIFKKKKSLIMLIDINVISTEMQLCNILKICLIMVSQIIVNYG